MAVGPKAKRRNSEKRKEHSRDAARCRRSREAEVFLHLSQEIPLSYDLVKVLDKTSMIRLTITYLKLRTMFSDAHCENDVQSQAVVGRLERKLDQLCQRALDGFVMVVASDGDVLFVTDNIAAFLGLTQIDVMGQSIFDLSHPCDHDELRELIGTKSHQPSDASHRTVFIRMKSTITSKGRNVHIKSASYKVIGCTGHLKRTCQGSSENGEVPFVVINAQAITHPSSVEVTLDDRTFVSRHSLDMKFTECDERICDLMGYATGDIIGKSMYSYFHALDTETLERAYKTLFCKGQTSTGLYRFLAQQGGYIWVETHATVVNNAVTDKPEHVVCVHYIVSGVEGKDTVFDVAQLSSKGLLPVEDGTVEEEDKDDLAIEICAEPSLDDDENDQSCIQFATEGILAQVVRAKQDSDLLSPDLSLYSIDKSLVEKSCDEVGDEEDDNPGMTKNFSNFSLTSLLDKMQDDGLEMRAPYVSMDDLVFSSSDTPLIQPHSSGSHLSSIMNSDPLMSSVDHESLLMTEPSPPPPPLFTINLSDTKVVLPSQKSLGTKRTYGGTDMSVLPCKAPRLDLNTEPPSYVEIRPRRSSVSETPDFVGLVSVAASQAGRVPMATTGQTRLSKPNVGLIKSDEERHVKFIQVAESNGSGNRERKPEEMPVKTVYLLLNSQQPRDAVMIPPDLLSGEARPGGLQRSEGITVYKPALNPNHFLEKVTDQFAVINDGDDAGSGKFVLSVTKPDGRVLKMVSGGSASIPPLISMNSKTSGIATERADSVMPVGTTVVDSRGKSVAPVHVFGTSGSGLITVDSLIGKLKSSPSQVEQPQTLDLNSTDSRAIRLISPSTRKTAYVMPTQKISTVIRQPLLQGGNVVQNLQNTGCFVGNTADVGDEHPLHVKLQNALSSAVGKVTLTRSLPNAGFLKTVLSGSVAKSAATGEDSAASETVVFKALPSGERVKPLYLVRKSAAPSWCQTGSALQKPGTTDAISNAPLFDDPKTASAKQPELQQVVPQRNKDFMPLGSENYKNQGPVSTQPLMSSCPDSSGSSVLKNLLMKGIDVNYGYRLDGSQSHSVTK